MITQIYEQELNAAFEMLLHSVDMATEKALQSQIEKESEEQARIHTGIGVELQGKILYFQELIIEHIKNANGILAEIQ